jgi:hypothetical protein
MFEKVKFLAVSQLISTLSRRYLHRARWEEMVRRHATVLGASRYYACISRLSAIDAGR